MKYMRTAGYIWTDYKTNAQTAKELKITPILDKLLEYKRNWTKHVNRMRRNRLPRVMKRYSPTGRRNHGRPLKRLLDTWDRNRSTSGPTPWQIYDDDNLQTIYVPLYSFKFWIYEEILSTPSFRGEVKPSVPCRRFAACKRSLELRGSRILDEICRNISRPRRVPPSAARGLSRRWTWRHLAEKVGTSKGGGKQWQPTPKNLPRMQYARAIPVAGLGSGSC